VSPWCTSNWQSLRYRVVRAGADPYFPDLLLAADRTIYLGNDPLFQLEGEPDRRDVGQASSLPHLLARCLGPTLRPQSNGFSLKFRGEYSLDGGILTRDHILSYRVDGNQVARVDPPALTAEDFLDEWVSMPWHDAARWSDPSNLSDLRAWHSFLHEKKSWTSDGLLFVQPCQSSTPDSSLATPPCPTAPNPTPSSPTQWQIGLALIPNSSDRDERSTESVRGDRNDSFDSKPKEAGTVRQAWNPSERSDLTNAASFETLLRSEISNLRFPVQLGRKAGGTPLGDIPSSLFFTVTRQQDQFIMKRIDSVRPPGCPGELPPEAFPSVDPVSPPTHKVARSRHRAAPHQALSRSLGEIAPIPSTWKYHTNRRAADAKWSSFRSGCRSLSVDSNPPYRLPYSSRCIGMGKEYVEQRDSAYWVAGSRVSLDSIVYSFLRGASPESITRSFPAVTLQ
jgi:hypothetical protein